MLVTLAVVVVGGCIAWALWRDPPASLTAALAAAVGVLVVSGIAEPFLVMIAASGWRPFDRQRQGRDADLVPVAPRSGARPEPGMWARDDVFAELARLVEADGAALEVLRTRGRVRLARLDASPPVACDLVAVGHQRLQHREVGHAEAVRGDIHEIIDWMISITSWQVDREVLEG